MKRKASPSEDCYQVARIIPIANEIDFIHHAQVARFQEYVRQYSACMHSVNSLHEPLVNTVMDLIDIRKNNDTILDPDTIENLKILVCATLWPDEWADWFSERTSRQKVSLDFGNLLKQASFACW